MFQFPHHFRRHHHLIASLLIFVFGIGLETWQHCTSTPIRGTARIEICACGGADGFSLEISRNNLLKTESHLANHLDDDIGCHPLPFFARFFSSSIESQKKTMRFQVLDLESKWPTWRLPLGGGRGLERKKGRIDVPAPANGNIERRQLIKKTTGNLRLFSL